MDNPPPPSLPKGWIACWDHQNKEWYYIEKLEGTSQWEIPTKPPENYKGSFPAGPTCFITVLTLEQILCLELS